MKLMRFFNILLLSAGLFILACNNSYAGTQQKILNGQATIEIPDGFVKVSNKTYSEKTGRRVPDNTEIWILPQEHGKVMLLLQMRGDKVTELQVSQLAGSVKGGGTTTVSPISNITVNGKKMSRLTMTTKAANGKLISLMQFSSVNGSLLIANFAIADDLKEKYTKTAEHTLSTLNY